jgi:hypothetical protein
VHILCYGYFVWFAVVLALSCRLFVVSIFPLALILGLGTLVPVGTSDASPALTGSCFALAHFTGKHRNFVVCCLWEISFCDGGLTYYVSLCVVTCTVVGWVICVLI